jgi:hypothetical protein
MGAAATMGLVAYSVTKNRSQQFRLFRLMRLGLLLFFLLCFQFIRAFPEIVGS